MQYQKQPEDCLNCLKDCDYITTLNYCDAHKIEKEDAFSGQHFCLEHTIYHCHKHWKLCCAKFGYSVMTARPVTTAHLHKRAQEIIEEQDAEIKKLEAYVEQLKSGRFICAECRTVACICNIKDFKYLTPKKKARSS